MQCMYLNTQMEIRYKQQQNSVLLFHVSLPTFTRGSTGSSLSSSSSLYVTSRSRRSYDDKVWLESITRKIRGKNPYTNREHLHLQLLRTAAMENSANGCFGASQRRLVAQILFPGSSRYLLKIRTKITPGRSCHLCVYVRADPHFLVSSFYSKTLKTYPFIPRPVIYFLKSLSLVKK